MGYIALDRLANIVGGGRAYTDGGMGYEPRHNFHIKWHPMPDYPVVVDRFHVTNELDTQKVYYFISKSGLWYAGRRPEASGVDRSFYTCDISEEVLKEFDTLARTFLDDIHNEIGYSRSGITREVKERERRSTARQAAGDFWLKKFDEVRKKRGEYITDHGIPAADLDKPEKKEFRMSKEPDVLAETYLERYLVRKRKSPPPPTPPGYELKAGSPAVFCPIQDDEGGEPKVKRRKIVGSEDD